MNSKSWKKMDVVEDDYLLGKAYCVASRAHFSQLDKCGKPYILHPVRVSNRCHTMETKIAALLHDVVEDSEMTVEDLRKDFPENIVAIVDILTKRDEETYNSYINRIIESKNRQAIEVKMMDLADNTDPDRKMKDAKKQKLLLAKYKETIKKLSEAEKSM